MRNMKTDHLSNKYTVRKLTEADCPAIYELCRKNPLYYRHCPPFVTEEGILRDMKALPPGKTMKDKFYIGFYDNNALTAVMDLIRGFPDKTTAFIGFFMVDISCQRHGVGSAIIDELCKALPEEGMSAVRLGWVKGNPQAEHFWKKNGFSETGKTSETDHYTIVYAEKKISC